ncbi:unnamed protein product [Meloidogyne enterolobii]
MASQKMFIGERNIECGNEKECAKLFWEAIAIYVKEFYTSLHIDVRSRKAIKGLGHFALQCDDSKNVCAYLAISKADYNSRNIIGWYFGHEHEDLCNSVFCFLESFLFIDKKKVWFELKPYLFRKKLRSKEERLDMDFKQIYFKKTTQKRISPGKQKLKKYFLFEAI